MGNTNGHTSITLSNGCSRRIITQEVEQRERDEYAPSPELYLEANSCNGHPVSLFISAIKLRRIVSEEIFSRDAQSLRELTNSANNRLFTVLLDIDDGLIRNPREISKLVLRESLSSSPVFEPSFHKSLRRTCSLSYIVHYIQTEVKEKFDKSVIVCYTNHSVTVICQWRQEGKIKATQRWQMTINRIIAVWLPHRGPGKIARDNPWCTLLIFIVTMLGNACQWLYKAWVRGKKVYP